MLSVSHFDHIIGQQFMGSLVVSLVILILGIMPATAQDVIVLSLGGHGAATVAISRSNQTAYIIDGGTSGEKGIRGATISNRPVLDYLLTQGVRNLVITNTHTHDDHLGGLRAMIEKDPNIGRFERLRLVETGVGGTPLKDAFERRYPQPPAGMVYEHRNASRGDNLYGGLARPQDNLVPNSVFTPNPKAGPNGNVIITEFNVQKDGQRTRVVNFSDADSRAVQAWITRQQQTGARTDVILLPHHGSARTNDTQALLNANLGIRQAIVSANRENKYGHPHTETISRAYDKLGPNNILITGTGYYTKANGSNITITQQGMVLRREDYSHSVRVFLDDYRRNGTDRRATQAEEKLFNDGYRGKATDPSWGKPLSNDQYLKQSERFLQPGKTTNGNERREIEQRSGQTPAERRASRLEYNVAPQSVPNYGGITVGAKIKSAPKILKKAELVAQKNGDEMRWALKITTDKGVAFFDEMTGAELWAARNFLRPSAQLLKKYPRLEDEPGLIHCEADYKCNTHPAITGTIIGFNAMRTDVMLSALQEFFFKPQGKKPVTEVIPPQLLRVKWEQFNRYSMLLWYDESPVIQVADGRVLIEASQGPPQILLRMRWLSNLKTPCDSKKEKCFEDRRINEKSLQAIYDHFPPLRRIDQFARTVAVLNWIWQSTGELPTLPAELEASRRVIPNPFPVELVF